MAVVEEPLPRIVAVAVAEKLGLEEAGHWVIGPEQDRLGEDGLEEAGLEQTGLEIPPLETAGPDLEDPELGDAEREVAEMNHA